MAQTPDPYPLLEYHTSEEAFHAHDFDHNVGAFITFDVALEERLGTCTAVTELSRVIADFLPTGIRDTVLAYQGHGKWAVLHA